ncbi:MAG: hypothetical protein QOF49_1097, partial [Chloroflexota bacterium]|nr:hypothetical protein [Chloroflexota bacterium]
VAPTTKVDAPIRVLRVGDAKGSRNQAIVALAVRPTSSGVSNSVFVSVANLDLEPATRRLEFWADDRLAESRTITIDAQQRADVVVDDIGDQTHPVSVVEVRLVGGEEPAGGARADLLAGDDRAWAVVPAARSRNVLIVGAGDPYLETALGSLPNTRLFALAPAQYPAGAVRTDGSSWDLIIFEGFVPATFPATPILAIAPPKTSSVGEVIGTLKNPAIATLGTDEPILRYVDLTTTHIVEAKQLALPAWARAVIPGPKGAPLLYSGIRAGLATAVLAFEPRQSDLPLQVAFPILLANLTGELLGGSAAPTNAIKPGEPVVLSVPNGMAGLHVVAPDGRSVDLIPGAASGPSVTYAATDQLGVYTATPIAVAGSTASAATSAAPSSTAPPSARPSGSGEPASGNDPTAPIRFAVDLFDVDESAIAPGPERVLVDLGTARPAPGASAAPGRPDGAAATRPNARDELWVPIVVIVLVALCLEWSLYHRDALQRAWRGLAGRMRRPAARGGA